MTQMRPMGKERADRTHRAIMWLQDNAGSWEMTEYGIRSTDGTTIPREVAEWANLNMAGRHA